MTVGFFILASIRAENIPTDNTGLSAPTGAIIKEVKIVKGLAKAKHVNNAASPPFHTNHFSSCDTPTSNPETKERTKRIMIIAGKENSNNLVLNFFGGISFKLSKENSVLFLTSL